MEKTAELRQKREVHITQMQDTLKQASESQDASRKAELLAVYDRMALDQTIMRKQIELIERENEETRSAVAEHMSDLEARGAKPGASTETEYRDAFYAWVTEQELTAEHRSILKRGTSTQVVGTTTLGGYLAPTGFWPMIEKSLKDYSGIFEAAHIKKTAKGNPIYLPTLDDTGTEAVLVAESGAFTVQDLTFGQKQFDAYAYRSLLKSSWELMQDAEFDMEAEINEAMMPRFGRALNTACTTGTGSSQPNGVVTASTAGVTAASATAITRAEMVDLIHKVDPAHRKSKKCGFMMHDLVLAAVEKLALGSGDASPLWKRSMREGVPDTIEGYPFWVNQAMDSALTTGKKVMLFGDFNCYTIRIVKELTVVRLNELYAANGQVGFYGFMRFDGEIRNAAAIQRYTLA